MERHVDRYNSSVEQLKKLSIQKFIHLKGTDGKNKNQLEGDLTLILQYLKLYNNDVIYVTRPLQNDTIHRPIACIDGIRTYTGVWDPQAPADGPGPLKYSYSAHGGFNCFGRCPDPIMKLCT